MPNATETAAGAGPRARRQAAGVLLLLAYPVLAHAAIASGVTTFAWAAWLCLAGLILLAAPGMRGVAAAALVTAMLFVVDADALLRFPPILFNLALAIWFGRSLLPGEEPVIGWFARLERGAELPQDLSGYTRGLTVIWTVFFIAMALSALALALFAGPQAWSVFANGVDYLLVGVLFVGEYVYRRLRYRHHRHASLAYHIRSVFAAGRLTPRRSAHR
jgi:uncharacterized membrane protein